MSTSYENVISSSVSAFACAIGHHGLPTTPEDVDQRLAASATLIDVHDASSALSPSASSSDGDFKDKTKDSGVRTFGMMQPKSGIVWLYQLVIALFVQLTTIASDIVCLKNRITAVESTPPVVPDPVTEGLARQVNELCERVASQQDRIAFLENSHCAETDAYKRTIEELITKIDNDLKTRNDALEKLSESSRLQKISMESQGASVTGIKAIFALKIHLLEKDMMGIQTELSALKKALPPVDAASACQVTMEESPKAQIPTSVTSPSEEAKEDDLQVPKTQILTSVTSAKETEEEDDLLNYPILPAIARILAYATATREMSLDLSSSGDQSIATPKQSETEETKVKIPKMSPAATRANADSPGANKMSAMPAMPAKGKDKENKPCDSSTTTTARQEDKKSKPGAGQSPNVRLKLSPLASPKKAQFIPGLASKISVLPKPRKSPLPALRKSVLPSLAKPGAVDDGGESKVKSADRLPGRSETQRKTPIMSKIAAIVRQRLSPESTSSRIVEKEVAAGLPASSSLEPLDAALRAGMEANGNDLLTLEPPLSRRSIDDLSFSDIAPLPPTKWRVKSEHIQTPLKPRSKPPKTPLRLRSTLAPLTGNEMSSGMPASTSLAARAAVQRFQNDGDTLTLVPVPGVDFTFSARGTPIFRGARLPFKRESIYVSPVKPSRRL